MQDKTFLQLILESLELTMWDILPIIIVLVFFQVAVIRKQIPHLKRIAAGFIMVLIGLAIFMVGLKECIFPLGISMAQQLADPVFLSNGDAEILNAIKNGAAPSASLYVWIIAFAFFAGFATTLAEPALIAVALKAQDVSTGAISPWGLRISVALGVAIGVSLGVYRIVLGTPLHYFIICGYIILLVQTYFAPRFIIPLAYDSGGVSTSTVTVPLVVALGIGMASNVPGRSALLDGFGLVAFACLFPIITVLAYAMISARLSARESVDLNTRKPE